MLPSGDSLRKVHVMVMMVMMVKIVKMVKKKKKCLRHADAQRAGRLEREPAG
jgi:heme exporter protein D